MPKIATKKMTDNRLGKLSAPPKGKDRYSVPDGVVGGLTWVRFATSKKVIATVRVRLNSRQHRVRLGEWISVDDAKAFDDNRPEGLITLEEARARARAEKQAAAQGIDTRKEAQHAQARRDARTSVSELVYDFKENKRHSNGDPLSPATMKAYGAYFRLLCKHLGEEKVADLRRADFLAVIKTVKGGVSKDHARRTYSSLLSYAVNLDLIEFNFLRGLKVGSKPKARQVRLMLEGDEDKHPGERGVVDLKTWYSALASTATQESTRCAILLAVTLGMRVNEIITLRRDDYDPKTRLLAMTGRSSTSQSLCWRSV